MSELIVPAQTLWSSSQRRLASGVWLMLASASIAIWIAGNMFLYQDLHQICVATPFECTLRRTLTADNVARLQILGLSLEIYVAWVMTGFNLSAAVCVGLGIFIFTRKAHDRQAWLTALFLVMYGGAGNNTHLRALTNALPELWLPLQGVSLLVQVLFITFFLTFPNGRFAPGWAVWVAVVWVVVFSAPRLLSGSVVDWYQWPGWALVAILVSMYGAVVGVIVYRYRRVLTHAEHQKTKWVCLGLLAALIGIIAQLTFYLIEPELVTGIISPLFFVQGLIVVLALSCIPLSIGIAILRSNLFDIDLILNRALVYGALTIFVVGAYALLVGVVGALLQVEGNLILSLMATGLVAVAFNPLRERLQSLVNRLVYGERDEPYRVLTRLGQQLETALEPAASLPLTVRTVAHALKLPYVAIRLNNHTEVVAYGKNNLAQPPAMALFPLIYAGETLGHLVVAERAPNESLTAADQRLLSVLAQQISVTAHATLVTVDLERARLRLVTAREETRRRLGSDLHDSVGHQLAGLIRQVELATTLFERDPSAARAILTQITQNLNVALTQVRGLAHQLHPPELELLGLVGAVRERAQAVYGFAIQVEAPDSFHSLPTAIETAAYYIVLEALTNIEKHATAKTCRIRLAWNDGIELEIKDDGRGLSADTPTGLGLLSMQARAAEVGGVCVIEPNPTGGTRVTAHLPCLRPVE